jgi:hypothetical protein
VLPTTPVSRLAHVGCSSKLYRNVVFPCLCFVKECGLSLLSQRDVMPLLECSFPGQEEIDRGRRLGHCDDWAWLSLNRRSRLLLVTCGYERSVFSLVYDRGKPR